MQSLDCLGGRPLCSLLAATLPRDVRSRPWALYRSCDMRQFEPGAKCSLTGWGLQWCPLLGLRSGSIRSWDFAEIGWECILKFTQSLIQHRRDAYCTSAGRTLAALGNQ